jgi:hypothetical protein
VDALLKDRKDLLIAEKKEEPKTEVKPAPAVPPVPTSLTNKPASTATASEPKKEEKPGEKP